MANPKQHNNNIITANEKPQKIAVIIVPFPAQSHLNQLLQLSCVISSYNLPVHYVGSTVHIRQAKARINGLSPSELAQIHFHDIPLPHFHSPPPDPNSTIKFPAQLQPAWYASLSLREPFSAFLRKMSSEFERVIVVHDSMMAVVVQDVCSVHNAESYSFNCISAFSNASVIWEARGEPCPVGNLKDFRSFEQAIPDEVRYLVDLQDEPMSHRAGDMYNTCRLIEAPFLEVIEREEFIGNRKSWAIGPILPSISEMSQHRCLEWLNKHEPNSVIYVSFGTTTSLSDDQIKELALGLERSKVKFLWVLRDADRGDVFDGEIRRAELPEGFEERVEGVGMVERDWAPQPQILAHPSTGGFMSHCGWNSCIESITMGVPIAAWPMHSDQPRNTLLITEILRMGVVVREWAERLEVVKASKIENVVRRLMASGEGEEMRKRAEELSATVREAAQPGGASRLELDSFIDHITR